MKTNHLAVALLTVALFGSSGSSMAADSNQSSGMPSSGMHGKAKVSGGGMDRRAMGAGMMKTCPMMMHHLPPGNEKLEMQMHGEMMKAMGDIMLKYADQIQPQPSK